jgi:hypothetical protein
MRRAVHAQAERRVAEELAEQMMLQASALMAEKARVQAENSALHQERDHLLERLEYMEQVGGCVGGVQARRLPGLAWLAWTVTAAPGALPLLLVALWAAGLAGAGPRY